MEGGGGASVSVLVLPNDRTPRIYNKRSGVVWCVVDSDLDGFLEKWIYKLLLSLGDDILVN